MKIWGAVLVVFLTGCQIWQQTGGQFIGAGYTLDLPQGWMASRDPKDLFITRDGEPLQLIRIDIIDITKYREDDKKRLRKGMLPEEAAQVIIDRIRSNYDTQFVVVDNQPTLIGGVPGFRLVYTYKMHKLRYKSIYYGMLQGEKFYRISYNAPIRYYFEKDAATFENIVREFTLGKGPKKTTTEKM